MVTVKGIRRGPERSLTSSASGAAISGAFRSGYMPFAPQPYPPGMSQDEWDALPGGDLIDCVPRYAMWREDARTPDYDGGDPDVVWTREPGWEFRADCAIPASRAEGSAVALCDGEPVEGVTVHLDVSSAVSAPPDPVPPPSISGVTDLTGAVDFGLLPIGTRWMRARVLSGPIGACEFDVASPWVAVTESYPTSAYVATIASLDRITTVVVNVLCEGEPVEGKDVSLWGSTATEEPVDPPVGDPIATEATDAGGDADFGQVEANVNFLYAETASGSCPSAANSGWVAVPNEQQAAVAIEIDADRMGGAFVGGDINFLGGLYDAQRASANAMRRNLMQRLLGAGPWRVAIIGNGYNGTFFDDDILADGHTIVSNPPAPITLSTAFCDIAFLSADEGLGGTGGLGAYDPNPTACANIWAFLQEGGAVYCSMSGDFPGRLVPLWTKFGITFEGYPAVFSYATVVPYSVGGSPYFDNVTGLNCTGPGPYYGCFRMTAITTPPDGGTNDRWQGQVGAGTPEYVWAEWRP